MEPRVVCVLILTISDWNYSCFAEAEPLCSRGLVYVPSTGLCCKPIRCDKGHEAISCTPDDPSTSYCRPCGHDKYREDISELGANDRCNYKKRCRSNEDEIITSCGNSTHDVTCQCKPGLHYNKEKTVCLRDKSIPKETTTVPPTTDPPTQASSTDKGTECNESTFMISTIVLAALLLISILIMLCINRKKIIKKLCRKSESTDSRHLNGVISMPLLENHTGNGSQPFDYELQQIYVKHCDRCDSCNTRALECEYVLANELKWPQLQEFRRSLPVSAMNSWEAIDHDNKGELHTQIVKTVLRYKELIGKNVKFSTIVNALQPYHGTQMKLVLEICKKKESENCACTFEIDSNGTSQLRAKLEKIKMIKTSLSNEENPASQSDQQTEMDAEPISSENRTPESTEANQTARSAREATSSSIRTSEIVEALLLLSYIKKILYKE